MAHFRKITVDDNIYMWRYSFDDYDWLMPSTLTIRTEDKLLKIILVFPLEKSGMKCPFNIGVDALKNGEPVKINLNQPRFTAEMIHYLFSENIVDTSKNTQYFNGLGILDLLGYRFSGQPREKFIKFY